MKLAGIILGSPGCFGGGIVVSVTPPDTGDAPANALMAEDGSTYLMAEDGTTYLTQE